MDFKMLFRRKVYLTSHLTSKCNNSDQSNRIARSLVRSDQNTRTETFSHAFPKLVSEL